MRVLMTIFSLFVAVNCFADQSYIHSYKCEKHSVEDTKALTELLNDAGLEELMSLCAKRAEEFKQKREWISANKASINVNAIYAEKVQREMTAMALEHNQNRQRIEELKEQYLKKEQ